MIIVSLIGGLGNQMFQYALGRKLSILTGAELKFDITGFSNYPLRSYELNNFSIQESFSNLNEILTLKRDRFEQLPGRLRCIISNRTPVNWRTYFREEKFGFDPKILKITDNAYLEGYWQSEKFFFDIREILINDFTPKFPPSQQSKVIAQKMRKTESVSIHVRRGDYLSNPEVNKVHGICSLEYYLQSIQYIMEIIPNPSLFIFSDDPQWTRTNIISDYPTTYVSHNPQEKDHEDLWLMTQCKHNIIANSSFSWWGAWLNQNDNKIIIAPKRWFNEGYYSDRDLVPEKWIRM